MKVSITLGFLHKLIKRCNPVNAGHEHDLLLETFEHDVYLTINNSLPGVTK